MENSLVTVKISNNSNSMKTIDILNKKFTVLVNVSGYTYNKRLDKRDYTQKIMDLSHIIELGKLYKERIDILRSMVYHSKEQKAYKEQFPCWFVGGIFPINKTEDKDILKYSNILAIDIDKCDNPEIDIPDIKRKIFELPYVFLISKSISGEGIYVLVLLEDGKNTESYYKYLVKLWKQKFNINIDDKCTNIGRKRFISYDEEILIKSNDADIKEWKLKYIEPKIEPKKPTLLELGEHQKQYSLVRKAIWYLLNNGYSIDNINTDKAYSVWYHVGCDFRHFDDGEDMFITFSNNTSKYKDSITKILSKWKQTKIENNIDDISRKWCGICKSKYGVEWIHRINEQQLF